MENGTRLFIDKAMKMIVLKNEMQNSEQATDLNRTQFNETIFQVPQILPIVPTNLETLFNRWRKYWIFF